VLEFLLDNPYILFLVIYAVVSLLRRAKSSAAGDKARTVKPVPRAAPTPAVARRPAGGSDPAPARALTLEERLEQLAADWERKLAGDGSSLAIPRREVMAAPAEAVTGSAEAGAPEVFAEPAVAEVVAGDRAAELESRSAFDLTRPTRLEAAAAAGAIKESPFAFADPSRSAEVERWHLGGFDAAVSATPARAASPQLEAPPEKEPTGELLFHQPATLPRAFVLAEILGKPRALRPWSPQARI
jgi:hypothetical protein